MFWFFWNQTVALLTEPRHWRAVKAVARALLTRRSLEGREVHSIIAEAFSQRGTRQ
jgi:hypothetical protein